MHVISGNRSIPPFSPNHWNEERESESNLAHRRSSLIYEQTHDTFESGKNSINELDRDTHDT